MKQALAASLALAILAAAGPAAAGPGEGLVSSLSFVLTGGALLPQEEELDPGTHFGLAALYETTFGVSIGAEGTLSRSNDPLRTRVAALALHARLSPQPGYHVAFLMVGAGVYSVTYQDHPTIVVPNDVVRPGGSFGFGFELLQLGQLSLGGSGAYHAVLFNRGDKLGFVEASATLTWRPGQL